MNVTKLTTVASCSFEGIKIILSHKEDKQIYNINVWQGDVCVAMGEHASLIEAKACFKLTVVSYLQTGVIEIMKLPEPMSSQRSLHDIFSIKR